MKEEAYRDPTDSDRSTLQASDLRQVVRAVRRRLPWTEPADEEESVEPEP